MPRLGIDPKTKRTSHHQAHRLALGYFEYVLLRMNDWIWKWAPWLGIHVVLVQTKHLPTTNSRISFHLISGVGSCTIVIRIRRWMPWCNKNSPRHGRSSLCSTTDGTYSPLGANSHISNQTSISCLANTVDDGGHGRGPNFGLRTGWLIGMLGGSMRRGGGRVANSCFAILCNGWCW